MARVSGVDIPDNKRGVISLKISKPKVF